jgi:hypothetical protein
VVRSVSFREARLSARRPCDPILQLTVRVPPADTRLEDRHQVFNFLPEPVVALWLISPAPDVRTREVTRIALRSTLALTEETATVGPGAGVGPGPGAGLGFGEGGGAGAGGACGVTGADGSEATPAPNSFVALTENV